MKKTIEKGSADYKAFTAVWELYQQFGIPEKNEEYWNSLIKAIKDLEDANNNVLAKCLAAGVANALQRIAKGET